MTVPDFPHLGELVGDLRRSELYPTHRDAVLQDWSAGMERHHFLLDPVRNVFHLDRLDGRLHGEGCEQAAARGKRTGCTDTVEGATGQNIWFRCLLKFSSSVESMSIATTSSGCSPACTMLQLQGLGNLLRSLFVKSRQITPVVGGKCSGVLPRFGHCKCISGGVSAGPRSAVDSEKAGSAFSQ
jgi:hypothetical protein